MKMENRWLYVRIPLAIEFVFIVGLKVICTIKLTGQINVMESVEVLVEVV
jgi:hypothetical protein